MCESRRARLLSRLRPARLGSAAFTVVAVAVWTAGCASTGPVQLSEQALQRHIEQSGASRQIVPYALDDEMRAWAADNVPKSGSIATRLGVLADRLLAPNGRGILYSRDTTSTAREVFDSGAANCLAFTNLFVGMARSVGIDVDYLQVRDLDTYSREDDLVVHSDHVAVGFGPRHQLTIIDFASDPGLKYRHITTLTDAEATALYYSNRGTELLREDAVNEAHRWLNDAVRIAPTASGAWVNLGVALRRMGRPAEAEAAYRTALEHNPAEFSAYQNLATLLRLLDREEEAFDLLALSNSSVNRNPYTFLALGDLSKKNGRWSEAEKYYRRALRIHREDAEPWAALGSVALQQGDLRAARKWLQRAKRRDPEAPRVLHLASELERVLDEDGRG